MPPPDCAACDRPELLAANQAAQEVFGAVADFLGDDLGGVRLENARLAAEALGWEWDAAMMAKVNVLIRVVLKKQEIEDSEQ